MKNKDLKIIANFEVKSSDNDDEDLVISGFANTTDKDRGGDVILESAWNKGGLVNYMKNPILLAFHDHTRPIGKTVDYSINDKGLHVEGFISKAAGDIYNLVKSGVLQAFSVGFRVKDADYDPDTDIFVIKDLELHEISVVSVPMNQNSLFSIKKSFDNQDEYNEFKNSFIKTEQKVSVDRGDTNVPDTKKEGVIELTPEQLQSQMDDAIAKAFAEADAKAKADEAAKALAITAGKEGAETLMKEFSDKLEVEKLEMSKALEGMHTELKEKSAEIEAMTKSKMSFSDSADSMKLTNLEVDTAVLVAKMVNKSVTDTDYFKNNLLVKAGDHLTGGEADNYETMFSTRMYDAIQDKLVIEPLFTNKIAMNSRSMVFPFNPEAGYANWVTDAQYKSTNNDSSGVARTHAVQDISLKAEKLASKESLGYEEEEDAIIPIIPIIQNAIARRMARTTDVELLRGKLTVETEAGITASLITGVATQAIDTSSATFQMPGAFGTNTEITVDDLQKTRRKMGSYGLNPSDVVYVVSEAAYYDLLEDPDFRTMDFVGENATILKGQIGSVNGSAVIISDSFPDHVAASTAAIAINTSNYLFGELRGLTTERDRDVLNQKNWLVTTRRFAFNTIAASDTSCAVLLNAAA